MNLSLIGFARIYILVAVHHYIRPRPELGLGLDFWRQPLLTVRAGESDASCNKMRMTTFFISLNFAAFMENDCKLALNSLFKHLFSALASIYVCIWKWCNLDANLLANLPKYVGTMMSTVYNELFYKDIPCMPFQQK